MIQLNKYQIDQVKMELSRRGIRQKKVLGELTDHIACVIEFKMANGTDFKKALAMVMADFGSGELSLIQLENHKSFRKQRRKTGFVTGVIAASLMFFAIIVRADDKPNIRPYQKNLLIVDGYFSSNINGFIYEVSGKLDIYATAKGVVFKVIRSNVGRQGISIILKHANGFQTIYTNLQQINVNVGDKINKGNKLGEIWPMKKGQKIYFTYKIMDAGNPVDPNKYY